VTKRGASFRADFFARCVASEENALAEQARVEGAPSAAQAHDLRGGEPAAIA
jgi:hypothetical protein